MLRFKLDENADPRQLAAASTREPLAGRLWIVEPGRIRIHEPALAPEGISPKPK